MVISASTGSRVQMRGRYLEAEAVQFYLAQQVEQTASANVVALLPEGDLDVWSTYHVLDTDRHETQLARALTHYQRARDIRENITGDQADWILRYLIGACLGEYRHAEQRATHTRYCDHDTIDAVSDDTGRLSRDSLVTLPFTLSRDALFSGDMVNTLTAIQECYENCRWEHHYGGSAWARIVDHVLLYLTDKIPATVFVDRAWDLEHNGGCVFNKLSGSIVTYGRIQKILDLKYVEANKMVATYVLHGRYLPASLVTLTQALFPCTADTDTHSVLYTWPARDIDENYSPSYDSTYDQDSEERELEEEREREEELELERERELEEELPAFNYNFAVHTHGYEEYLGVIARGALTWKPAIWSTLWHTATIYTGNHARVTFYIDMEDRVWACAFSSLYDPDGTPVTKLPGYLADLARELGLHFIR